MHASDGCLSFVFVCVFVLLSVCVGVSVPVSEPVLSLICLSGGETQVTCSSEGEPVEYRWSLDSQSLTNISISNQSHHTTTITLQGHMTGSVTCEVQNDISTNRNTIQLSACSGTVKREPQRKRLRIRAYKLTKMFIFHEKSTQPKYS